jgi:hypothetical protein
MKPLRLLIVIALAACSSTPPRTPTEYDVVLKRPRPSTDEARRQECTWIETSLAREKNLTSYVTATSTYPASALAQQDASQRNAAVLNSRSQQIGCQTASAAAPFDQCFARCTQFTGRTKEQCFDACNK